MKKKILSIALVFMLGASVLAGCGPVSYTHLTVYDRQFPGRCGSPEADAQGMSVLRTGGRTHGRGAGIPGT